jgi:phage recombination protein Bet
MAASSLPSNVTKLNDLMTIDTNVYTVLKETLYPGAKDESIAMVLSYCKARKLDPIKKPVHLVPMSVKTGKKDGNGKDIYEYRDVVMPGIGLYRIEADRSGLYAGMTEPEFGEDVTETLGSIKVTYPKWCKITVNKYVGDRIVGFTAKEFWKENYATKARGDVSPNAMWEKRAYGQLAKCAEAQALRKAFPDVVGQDYTMEEMQGKSFPEEERKHSKPVSQTIEGEKVETPVSEPHDIEKDCMDIAWANDVTELQEIYTVAYKYWMNLKNKPNMARLVDAKDKRKVEIEAAVGSVNPETGEVKA